MSASKKHPHRPEQPISTAAPLELARRMAWALDNLLKVGSFPAEAVGAVQDAIEVRKAAKDLL